MASLLQLLCSYYEGNDPDHQQDRVNRTHRHATSDPTVAVQECASESNRDRSSTSDPIQDVLSGNDNTDDEEASRTPDSDLDQDNADPDSRHHSDGGSSPNTHGHYDPVFEQSLQRRKVQADVLQRRRKMLKEHQVLAALYFVRRMTMFIKYIVKHKSVVGGEVTDWVIRYETQGRGSVHAHILWWIKMDPDYVDARDKVVLSPAILDQFHLREMNSIGQMENIYNEMFLDFTNSSIWALQSADNIKEKLNIEPVDIDPEEYVMHSPAVSCFYITVQEIWSHTWIQLIPQ